MHKKILEIAGYPPPRSGWNMRIYFLRREMLKQGYDCQVLNIGKNRHIPSPDYISVQNGLDYLFKLTKLCLKGYRVHGHLNGDSEKGLLLTFLGQLISLLTGKRSYLTFHAGPVQKYFPAYKSKKFYLAFKLNFLLPKKIICNNNAVKKSIVTYKINPDKIVPIQAFSKQYLEFKEKELRPQIKSFMKDKKHLIVSYGYMRPEFFWDQLIHAFSEVLKKLPGTGLIIMGFDKGNENLVESIKNYGISDYVMFAGDLDHDEFLTMLKNADVYLRTPVKDGVASSVLEALSMGTPVIAAENGIRPESTITYDNNNFQQMIDTIVNVLKNIKEYKEKVIKPEIRDTLQEEIDLLVEKDL